MPPSEFNSNFLSFSKDIFSMYVINRAGILTDSYVNLIKIVLLNHLPKGLNKFHNVCNVVYSQLITHCCAVICKNCLYPFFAIVVEDLFKSL